MRTSSYHARRRTAGTAVASHALPGLDVAGSGWQAVTSWPAGL